MRPGLLPALIFALLSLFLPTAQAQQVRARATLSDSTVEAGEPVELRLEIEGARTASRPAQIQVEGLVITPVGQSSQFNWGPQGMVASVIYSYQIETSRAGTFTIPSLEFAAGGQMMRTSPLTLTVTAAGRARRQEALYFAELIVPKKTAWVGEAIPVELRVYYSQRVRAEPDQNPVLKGEGFTAQKFTEPRVEDALHEGRPYRVAVYKSSLTPLKSGPVTLGPTELNSLMLLPRPRPRGMPNDPFMNDPFFSDPFGGFAVQKRVQFNADAVAIEVKALPAGAPASFGGAIGQFTVDAPEADPPKVKSGDPVTVKLTVRGRGNFDRVPAPVLLEENGWRTYPASGKFRPDDDAKLSGAKVFEQVVVPLAKKTGTPRYEFAWFDPSAGEYRTAAIPSVPLTVEGAPQPSPTPGAAADASPAAEATPTTTPAPAADILHIRTDGPGRAERWSPLWRSPWFWGVQLAPLVALSGLLGWRWWQSRPGRNAARQAARRRARATDLQRLLADPLTPRETFYEAAARLAQLRAAALPGSASPASGLALTAEDVVRLASLSEEDARPLREAFRQRDEITFGGRDAGEPVPAAERAAVLAALEKIRARVPQPEEVSA